jgi:hypothetical protein
MNRLVLSFHASSFLVMAVTTCSLAGEANNEAPENAAVDYVVPQGNVSELKSYIERLINYRPVNPADVVEYRSEVRPALQEAAERILKLEKDHQSEAYEAARLIVLNNRVYGFARAVPAEQRRVITAVGDYLE